MRWIDCKDITKNVNQEFIDSLSEIDRMSLGGTISKRKLQTKRDELCKRSNILHSQLHEIDLKDPSKTAKVISFYSDFDKFIKKLDAIYSNAYVIMTIGNRTVAKQKIKMDEILTELFSAHHFDFCLKFGRRIPRKRMSIINARDKEAGAPLESMTREHVIVFKKR